MYTAPRNLWSFFSIRTRRSSRLVISPRLGSDFADEVTSFSAIRSIRTWEIAARTEVRANIDRIVRHRKEIGTGYLFPALNDSSKPMSVEVASAWLLKAVNRKKPNLA